MHQWKCPAHLRSSCITRRFILLMGGFLLFFIAFFTVHAVFKVGALKFSLLDCYCC